MYLKAKTYQSRRDFRGIFACNHCDHEHEEWGYDDANYHHNVIPNMTCPDCGKKGGGKVTDPTIPAHVVI